MIEVYKAISEIVVVLWKAHHSFKVPQAPRLGEGRIVLVGK